MFKFLETKNVIFTIGYEGRPIKDFLLTLKEHNIKRIIDVRRHPFSRNACYGQHSLSRILQSNGITYLHTPQLAPESVLLQEYKLKGFTPDNFEQFAKKYIQSLELKKDLILQWNKMLNSHDCLLCREKEEKNCHRSLLSRYIESFSIIHI